MSLVEAASGGDRRLTLEALRDRLAAEVEREARSGFCDVCKRSSSSVAPLAKQLADVLAQLDALPKATKGTPLDELDRRRKERDAATGGDGAVGGQQPR